MIFKHAVDKALALALTLTEGMDFSQDDGQLEGPNDWMCLAVIGCRLSSQIEELRWSGWDEWRF